MDERLSIYSNGVLLLCLFGKNASACMRVCVCVCVQLSAVLCGTGVQCASAVSRCSTAEPQEE